MQTLPVNKVLFARNVDVSVKIKFYTYLNSEANAKEQNGSVHILSAKLNAKLWSNLDVNATQTLRVNRRFALN